MKAKKKTEYAREYLFVMGMEDAEKIAEECRALNDNMIVHVQRVSALGIPSFIIKILPQRKYSDKIEVKKFKDITDYDSW